MSQNVTLHSQKISFLIEKYHYLVSKTSASFTIDEKWEYRKDILLYSRLYSWIMEILREYISLWLVAFGGATFLATFYFSLCQKRLLGAIHQRELNKESKVLEKPWNKTYLLRWNICKSKHSNGNLGTDESIFTYIYTIHLKYKQNLFTYFNRSLV